MVHRRVEAAMSTLPTGNPAERIEQLVEDALRTLPEPLRGAAEELLIVVDGFGHHDCYGVFDGVPRGLNDADGLPPRITIYAQALTEDFSEEAALRAEVRTTLVHEIGHYLGLDEHDLAARGLE